MAVFEARTFQLALGAIALSLAGFASAQPADAAAQATAPAAAEVVKPAPKKAPRAGHHHKHHHHMHDGKASSREEAAANSEARRGRLDNGQGATQYERNAFARCQVFKTDVDRMACADRVKQGSVTGSVEGGGILRESVIQVPVRQ